MGASYSFADIPSLEGKTAIITGASAGIGKVCALEMARRGCHIIMACRSKEKTMPVIEAIQKETDNGKVEFMELDLSSLHSTLNFTKSFKETGYPLHILLNNAGVMACPYTLSPDGIELQFATNHLGHFLLTNELLDVLIESAPSRIINVSSDAHKFAPSKGILFDQINDADVYTPWKSYGQSKLCNILFTIELAKRLKDKQVYCNSLHPGIVATELTRNMKDIYGVFGSVLAGVGGAVLSKSPEKGSLTSLYVATSPEIEEKEITGKYFVPTAKETEPSTLGTDEELAAKLWEFSENLIKEKLSESEKETETKKKKKKNKN